MACVGVFDLGHQEVSYAGEVSEKHQICFVFEVLDVADSKGAPFLFAHKFTLSLASNGNLRPFLDGWTGKKMADGDEPAFLEPASKGGFAGRYAYARIDHVPKKSDPSKTFAQLNDIKQVPKPLQEHAKKLKPQTTPVIWEIETAEVPTLANSVFLFGKKLSEVIGLSRERRGRHPDSGGTRTPSGGTRTPATAEHQRHYAEAHAGKQDAVEDPFADVF